MVYLMNCIWSRKCAVLVLLLYSFALYPGPTQFFNVARLKTGRPGQSGDVIRHSFGHGFESPPTRPRVNGPSLQAWCQEPRVLALRSTVVQ